MTKRTSKGFRFLTVGLVLTGACISGAIGFDPSPASAQYYRQYGAPQPDYDDGYYRPRPRPYYRQPYGGNPYGGYRQFGSVCVTSRGSCQAAPSDIGAGCKCDIPGFGRKRGNVQY